MKKEELLQYYDYLNRLATAKCDTQADTEDLVADTMLAAFMYLHRGGIINHPKTWLSNTLMYKYNSILRKKYRSPNIVNLDFLHEIADENAEDSLYISSEEASEVRKELLYLSKINREVLIRYYFNGDGITAIAKALGIPDGTVKSRLFAGRNQLKKGLEHMESKTNYLPGRLHVSNSGSCGPNIEPMSLVENDLIVQNLLILAYNTPLKLSELAKAIGIPTVYIEPIVERLVNGELMVHTDGDKYYTDFIIYKPEDTIASFDPQLIFVREHFDIFWSVMSGIIQSIAGLSYSASLNPRQLKKLERYAIMRSLQNFELYGSGKYIPHAHPARKDGGSWTAMGNSFPAEYNYEKYEAICEYMVSGGHRTSGGSCDYQGAKSLTLYEFDTTLWDSPHRFTACGFENYFNGIINLLWCVYKGISPQDGGIKNALIESIPALENVGLLSHESGRLTVDVPVMDKAIYSELTQIINDACELLIDAIGEDYRTYLCGAAIPIPSHIKSVPEFFRYAPATRCIVMSAVREAYDRGLHLHDVDYCCPPVVLVYEE